jgi:serine/threonine protein kinase/DNA-binding beta-propeller fold protein YncE
MVTEENPGIPGRFAPGAKIAGYRLEEQIGQGGMAVVFRAHDERLDRTVALKILAPALAADEAFRQRFIRESRAAAAVDDPHIIPVFEAGESSGVLFIAMRYVRGGDVRSMLQQGPLPPGRVAEIVSQVASALDAAHGHGLVHRDVKPANMLLDSRGGSGRPDHVYLSDFGLSKTSLQATGLTGTGMFIGTLDYISPEQIEGRPVDGRADQYALACAAYELITGTPPFQRADAMAVMYAQLTEPAPPVTSRRPDLPVELDDVFAKALAKPVENRYLSCTDFAEALRAALGIRPYDSGPGSIPSMQHPPTQVVTAGEGPTVAASSGPRTADAAGVAGAVGREPSLSDTAVTQRSDGRETSPDLTAAHWQADSGGQVNYRRPRWRSPGSIAAAIILIAVLAGGGSYLALHKSSKDKNHKNTISALTVPGCTATAATAPKLPVPYKFVGVAGGDPFGVEVTSDGRYVFAITKTTLNVLTKGPGLTLTLAHSYPIAGAFAFAQGGALTRDGKYLLVANGTGIEVLSIANAEAGATSVLVGTLTVPDIQGNALAVEVVLSRQNKFVFVTLKSRDIMAVFNLHKALTTNAFGSSSYVGSVHLGSSPVGMALSPNGKWLYVTSYSTSDAVGTGPGLLSVLDVAKAEINPATSVVAKTGAGCAPARVITSADGKMVWVTVRSSNALLAFSASLLRTDPKHALKAEVLVGQTPIGEILVKGGSTIVVADTDVLTTGPTAHNLAVVNVADALAGKPALVGFIHSGLLPREFAIVPGGRYLIVADNGSKQVQVVDLSKLP